MIKNILLLLMIPAFALQTFHGAAAEGDVSPAAKLQQFKARNKGLFGAGVAPGTAAPDFELEIATGDTSGIKGAEATPGKLRLSRITGDKPVVLVFGSHTCAPFRDWIPELEKLHQAYKDKAIFVLVYEKEMHPGDKTAVPAGQPAVSEAKTADERKAQAKKFAETFKVTMPVVVDNMDDSTAKAYHTMPMRNYIIGADGKIAFRGLSGADRGPFGFSTLDTEKKLRQMLGLGEEGRVFTKSAAQEKWAKAMSK